MSQPPPKTPINLLRGWPSPDLLPASGLRKAAEKVLSDRDAYVPALQYGPDGGSVPLREAVADWLGRFYRVASDASRICITGGASQSLACILQSYSDPVYTRAVWMVAPCYFLACPIFTDSGFAGKLRAFPEDDEGADLAFLEREIQHEESSNPDKQPLKHPKSRKLYRHIIYVVPTCANPSGKSMSVERRVGLVRLARKYDALVVCDDVYDLLQWSAHPHWYPPSPDTPAQMRLPRLCDIDRDLGPAPTDLLRFGHAVSNGSFSKLVGPGVRTGWVEASPAFAFGLSRTGSSRSGGAPSQMSASILCEMLCSGDIDSHVRSITRPALQRRHRLAVQAVEEHLRPLGVGSPEEQASRGATYGGYFIWISLPRHLLADAVAERAKADENLLIGHGSLFQVEGDEKAAEFKHNVRLSFSWESEEAIVEGVRRLASVISGMQAAET